MAQSERFERDPQDIPKASSIVEKTSGPLNTGAPIPDPGEAAREKLLKEAGLDSAPA